MPKVKITREAKTIAEFCEGIGVQFIRVAGAIRRGADPEQVSGWDEDDIDTYFLECYGALTSLMASERVIKEPIGV
jgi:hypothetical protein